MEKHSLTFSSWLQLYCYIVFFVFISHLANFCQDTFHSYNGSIIIEINVITFNRIRNNYSEIDDWFMKSFRIYFKMSRFDSSFRFPPIRIPIDSNCTNLINAPADICLQSERINVCKSYWRVSSRPNALRPVLVYLQMSSFKKGHSLTQAGHSPSAHKGACVAWFCIQLNDLQVFACAAHSFFFWVLWYKFCPEQQQESTQIKVC